MSRHNYVGKSGYDDFGMPLSKVSYDGSRGTRTYVTRIEEQVERVRRPSIMGSVYSLDMEAEKEGRPREVDDFIMKILDEVNGPPISTTRESSESTWDRRGLPTKVGPTSDYREYHADYPRKADPVIGYYEVEYTYVGRPIDSRIPRNYGSQRGDIIPNRWDDSRLKSETQRDSEVPKNRWAVSSRPIYDALPYNPPRDDSHSSKSYETKPVSLRDHRVSSNRLEPETAKEYGAPRNRWTDYSNKPWSPEAYGDPSNHWSKSSNSLYDEPRSNNNNDKPSNTKQENSPKKPQTLKGYGDSYDSQWSSPVKPFTNNNNYGIVDKEDGRYSDQEHRHSPRYGAQNNQWGNSLSKPVFDHTPQNEDNIGVVDRERERGNSSLKPQSPKDHGITANSNPNYDHPPQTKDLRGGSKRWENSPLKPIDDNYCGTLLDGRKSSFSTKPKLPTSPNYEHPSQNDDVVGGVSNNPWVKPPSSPRDYGVRENQWSTPSSPINRRPLKAQIVPQDDNIMSYGGVSNNIMSDSPLKIHSPRDYGARDGHWDKASSPVKLKPLEYHQVPKGQNGPEFEHPPRNDISNAVSSNRWGNSPLKTQNRRSYEANDNQQDDMTSNLVKHVPLKGVGDSIDQKGRSASPLYEHPPRNEITRGVSNEKWGNPHLKVKIPREKFGD